MYKKTPAKKATGKKRAAKKKKTPKLEPKARIRRRLFRLWSEKVQALHDNTCAISGIKRGEVVDGVPAILDAHHLEDRKMCAALRYDPLNGILLTKRHHKFGKNSAHRGQLWFAAWLEKHRPLQLEYVLSHRDGAINLDDREVLAKIETGLKQKPTEDELKVLGYSDSEIERRMGALDGQL